MSNLRPQPIIQDSTPPRSAISAASLSLVAGAAPGLALYVGIFLTAGAVLLLEIAFTRIFAVLLWAHLAFMVVSTALFGFGLSGVFLALRGGKLPTDLRGSLAKLSFFMSFAIIGAYLVITNVPFRMWRFHDEPIQFLYLATWYIALVLPFFLAGLIIASLLEGFPRSSSRLYGADLIGAAAGSLLIIPLITPLGGEGVVVFASLIAAVSGLFYTTSQHPRLRALLVITAIGFLVLAPKADTLLPLKMHEQKRRFTLAMERDLIYRTRWSTLSRVDIGYHRKNIYDIWIDGGTNESAITAWSGNLKTLKPQNWSSIGAVYDLKNGANPRVNIIGPAGGKEVLFALSHGASHVDAVEMDPSIVKIVNEPEYADFMGRLYQNERVTLINDEGRSYLRRQPDKTYDIIQFVNNYTPVAIASGALNLSSAFLLTKEAFHDYLDKLSDDGVLALHRGAALRVAITAMETLHERGVADPGAHIAITAGEVPYFDGFFLKKSPWTEEEINKLFEYQKTRPRVDSNGAVFHWNPFHRDRNTIYHDILNSPVSDLHVFYRDKGINLFPPTDDQPFIENFLQFGKKDLDKRLPSEFLRRDKEKWRGIIPRGDFPYVAILVESAFLALLFVVAPLAFFARSSIKHPGFKSFFGYFSCLGFGFIMIEICLMKKYVLFLGNPAYSITTVLVVLLLGAGIGSMVSSRLGQNNPRRAVTTAIGFVALVVLSETFLSPYVFQTFLAETFLNRIAIASLLLLPIGFVLGMPFPYGLQLISRTTADDTERRKIIAWAWGINGFMTVVGSAATVFIAVFAGFKAALFTGLVVYLLALLAIRSASKTA